MSKSPQGSPRGLTLVELLIVIAVIGILLCMLLPAGRGTREASRRAQCQNNIRQIMLATVNYESEFGRFPSGASQTLRDDDDNGASLFAVLLPYMDQGDLFDSSLGGEDVDNLAGTVSAAQMPILICPSAPQASQYAGYGGGGDAFGSHYVGLAGSARADINGSGPEARIFTTADHGIIGCDGVFSPYSEITLADTGSTGAVPTVAYEDERSVRYADIGDGASNTFAFGEYSAGKIEGTEPSRGPWAEGAHFHSNSTVPMYTVQVKSILAEPNSRDAAMYNDPDHRCDTPLNSSHPGGLHMARADGSVVFLEDSIPVATLQYLSCIDDGVTISDF